MRVRLLVATLLAVILTLGATAARADSVGRPSWSVGDFWTYATNTTIVPGLNLTGTATSTVTGTRPTDVGGGLVAEAYRLVLSGEGTASGTVELPNGTVRVDGRWIVTGEDRFEPTNLHPIYSLLDLSVNGTYQAVFPFSLRVQNTTILHVLDDGWQYPLTVGGSGSLVVGYNFTQDLYGAIGGPFHDNGTGQWTLSFSLGAAQTVATPAGPFVAYPVVETFPDGREETAFFSPTAGNDVRTEGRDPGGNLTSITLLTGYRYQALEPARFLGLTLTEWAILLPVVAAAGISTLLVVRRSRRRKGQRTSGEPSEPTSGPRGP